MISKLLKGNDVLKSEVDKMINSINTAAVQSPEVKNATIVPFKSQQPAVEEQAPDEKKVQTSIDEQRQADELKKAREKTPLEERKEEEITQALLDGLSMDIDTLHSIGLSFAQHEDTGRTMVKVMNRDTDELIREIPAEKVLDMVAKMDEMIGMLFDAKV